MSSPEMDHRRDRRSSSLNRGSSAGGRSYSKSQYDDYASSRPYRDRLEDKSQVIASGFPIDVSDREIKDAVHHELERFGDILSVHVRGREQHRQAVVSFREEDAAKELRRFCLERHCKVVAFQRTLHFDFDSSGDRGGDYQRTGDRGNSYYNNRGSFNQRNNYSKGDYKNARYNDRNDFDKGRNFNQGRGGGGGGDRYNNDNHINPRATRTLFVGNLDHAINKEELMRIFDHWGAIDDIDVKRPPNGIPAYAFIKYLELEAAASAKNQMFGKEINGRPIKVGYGKTLPSTRLWIGGLGNWCTAEMLNREFDRFGALRLIDYQKGSRHAFVEFESLDASSAAHAEMRGFPLGGPDRKIKIDYAEPDRKRNEERGRDVENRSDEDRDYNKGNYNKYENNRRDNQSDYSRDRGRDNSYRRNDNDERNDRRRSRSRSPINGDRGDNRNRNSSPDSKEATSPNQRTRNDSSPRNPKALNGSSNKTSERPSTLDTSETNNNPKPSESLTDVSKRFVVAWRGAFALKNSAFPVRMHLIGGNPELANFFLRGIGIGAGPAIKVLSITQRLRLDPPKLDEVSKRIQQLGAGGHCVLLALPTGDDVELDGSYQRRPLKSLVTYFKKKEAAGVIILNSENAAGKQEESGMLHAFPPCEFSQQQLLKVAPNVGKAPSNEDHLIVIVVKGTTC